MGSFLLLLFFVLNFSWVSLLLAVDLPQIVGSRLHLRIPFKTALGKAQLPSVLPIVIHYVEKVTSLHAFFVCLLFMTLCLLQEGGTTGFAFETLVQAQAFFNAQVEEEYNRYHRLSSLSSPLDASGAYMDGGERASYLFIRS